jgi:hypothetical protein
MNQKKLVNPSSAAEVAEFLRKAAITPGVKGARGRLIFALDATASRQPTWDRACQLQAEMFTETARLGGLDLQLVWYRGFREFTASSWLNEALQLVNQMASVTCAGGLTQLERVLAHAVNETCKHRINALVFIGDCMEENVDKLCVRAGELGLCGVPAFLFQEGNDPVAAQAFRQIAQLSHGAYCAFDHGSAKQLRELLNAVAVYAAGGRPALESLGRRTGGLVLQLTQQLRN